jgi:cell division protein FtsX
MGDEIKKEDTQEETQVAEKHLDEMTVKELREIAREIPGVTGFSIMKKEELLSVIKKDRGIEEEIKEETQPLKKPLDKMTAKELKEIAIEIPGVTGVTAMKKEELLTLIKKDRGIEDEKPTKKKEKKIVKATLSVKELKKKIVQFRLEKEGAREAKDRKKVDILRRRINRLKKQTRRVAQG